MYGDFDEDEDQDFEPDEEVICVDCQRIGSHWDICGICGRVMCSACFEMGCGVCMRPHRGDGRGGEK